MKIFQLLCLIAFASCTLVLQAQSTEFVSGGITKNGKNYLLWLPKNYHTLELMRDNGIVIEREAYALADGTPIIGGPPARFLFAKNPLHNNYWLDRTNNDDDSFAAYMHAALHDTTFNLTFSGAPTLSDLEDLENEKSARLMIANLALGVDFSTARRFGAGYYDKTAGTDTLYQYFVRIRYLHKDTHPSIFIRPDTESEYKSYFQIDTIESNGNLVSLHCSYTKWNTPYSCYDVYKRTNNGPWELANPLSKVPLHSEIDNSFVLQDTLINCTDSVEYYVRGIDPFNLIKYDAHYSELVSCSVPDPTSKTVPRFDSVVSHKNRYSADVSFSLPDSNYQDAVVIEVQSSLNPSYGYTTIADAPGGQEHYSLFVEGLLPSGYLRIRVTNIYGETYISRNELHEPLDDIPPSPVEISSYELTGRIGNTLRLHWPRSPEKDFLGYRVFRSHACESGWVEISGGHILDTFFDATINLNTLNKETFFSVIAVDFRFNETEVRPCFKVPIPDIVAPVAAQINNITIVPAGLLIDFEPTLTSDIKSFSLVRNDVNGANVPELIGSIDKASAYDNSTFLDSTTIRNRLYRYVVLTTDSSGNAAKSQPFLRSGSGGRAGSPPFVKSVELFPSQGTSNVRFTYMDTVGLQEFHVYRGVDGDDPIRYAILPVNTRGQLPNGNANGGVGGSGPVTLSSVPRIGSPSVSSSFISPVAFDYEYIDADAPCASASGRTYEYFIVAIHNSHESAPSNSESESCP